MPGPMLSNRDHGILDLFLEQTLTDFQQGRRTRTETLNELQHFITSLDADDETEVRRALARADGRSRGA